MDVACIRQCQLHGHQLFTRKILWCVLISFMKEKALSLITCYLTYFSPRGITLLLVMWDAFAHVLSCAMAHSLLRMEDLLLAV